jgi:hypothetical protein
MAKERDERPASGTPLAGTCYPPVGGVISRPTCGASRLTCRMAEAAAPEAVVSLAIQAGLAVRHHVDIVLPLAPCAQAGDAFRHAALAGPFVHRSGKIRERRDRFLSYPDRPRGRGWNPSRGLSWRALLGNGWKSRRHGNPVLHHRLVYSVPPARTERTGRSGSDISAAAPCCTAASSGDP